MRITELVRKNPRADNITIFNFMDCVDKYPRRPWKLPVAGSDELVT